MTKKQTILLQVFMSLPLVVADDAVANDNTPKVEIHNTIIPPEPSFASFASIFEED